MGDHQGRPVAVSPGPLVGVDLNLLPIVYTAPKRDVKGIKQYIESLNTK